MKEYADVQYYDEDYLCGRDPLIPEKAFRYWTKLASAELHARTFGRIDMLDECPDVVKMCCCEVAEKLYLRERAKDDNGLVLQSYSNDGDSGTYKVDELSAESIRSSIDDIVDKWLGSTGLTYLGVDDEPQL